MTIQDLGVDISLLELICRFCNLRTNDLSEIIPTQRQQNYRLPMRVIPQIQNYAEAEFEIDFQTIEAPTLQQRHSVQTGKYSMAKSHQTYNTYSTLNSPPILPTEYSFKKQVKECRICLENSEETEKQIIKVCKCSGSVEFVHRECFKEWIQKSLTVKTKEDRKKMLSKREIECQMCKQKIKIGFSMQSRLCQLQKVKQNIDRRAKLFTIIVVILTICLPILGFVIYSLQSSDLTLDAKNEKFLETLLMVVALALLIILSILAISFIIEEFFVEYYLSVDDIRTREERQEVEESQSHGRKMSGSEVMLNPESPLHFSPATMPTKPRVSRLSVDFMSPEQENSLSSVPKVARQKKKRKLTVDRSSSPQLSSDEAFPRVRGSSMMMHLNRVIEGGDAFTIE